MFAGEKKNKNHLKRNSVPVLLNHVDSSRPVCILWGVTEGEASIEHQRQKSGGLEFSIHAAITIIHNKLIFLWKFSGRKTAGRARKAYIKSEGGRGMGEERSVRLRESSKTQRSLEEKAVRSLFNFSF